MAKPFCKTFTENCNPIGIGSFENTKSILPFPSETLLSSLNTTLELHFGWNLPTLPSLSAIEPLAHGNSSVATMAACSTCWTSAKECSRSAVGPVCAWCVGV